MITKTLSNLTTPIKYIHHLADIHIRKTTDRQREYKNVLENLKKAIEPYSKNSLIVICGDIFHEKNNFNDVSVDLFNKYFDTLSDMCPVLVILGNHDGYTLKDNRRDCLKPFMGRSLGNNPVYYLESSGVYYYNNIAFGVSSELDKCEVRANDIKDNSKIKIALFHGQVAGSKLDNNTFIQDQYDKKREFFNGYDYTLLGDIHRFQYLDKDKRIAYCGSLIQQSFGEDPFNHGYIRWNLNKGKGKFVKIANTNVRYKMQILDKKVKELEPDMYQKNVQLKVQYKNITEEECQKVIDLSFKNRNCKFEFIKMDRILDLIDLGDGTRLDELDGGYYNLENQNKIIKEFAQDKNNKIISESKIDIDESIIKELVKLNTEFYSEINQKSKNSFINFELVEMTFSNLFAYGENNYIDFRKTQGVTGLMANNGFGKSSIIDIILYVLYEDTTKKSINGKLKISDMINEKKNNFEVSLKIKVNKDYYLIKKNAIINKNSQRAGSVNVSLLKLVNGEFKLISAKDTNETRNLIGELVGDSKSFILTNALLQEARLFIDLSKSDKMQFIMGLFDINVFSDLSKKAFEKIKTINELIKYDKNNLESLGTVSELQSKKKNNKKSIEKSKDVIINLKDTINEINQNINGLHKKMHVIDKDKMTKNQEVSYKISENNKNISKLKARKDKLENLIKPIKDYTEDEINNLEEENNIFESKKEKDIKNTQDKIEKLNRDYTKIEKVNIESLENNKKTLVDNIDKLKNKISLLEGKIEKYKNLDEPILNESSKKKCLNLKELKDKCKEKESQLEKLLDKITDATNASKKYKKVSYDKNCKYCMANPFTKEAVEKISKIKELNVKKSEIEDSIDSIKKLLDKGAKYENYIDEYEKEKKIYEEGIIKRDNLIAKLENRKSEFINVTDKLEMIQDKLIKGRDQEKIIARNKEIEEKINEMKLEIENINKRKLDNYENMMQTMKQKNKNNKCEKEINTIDKEINKLEKECLSSMSIFDEISKIEKLIDKNNLLEDEVSELEKERDNSIKRMEKLIEVEKDYVKEISDIDHKLGLVKDIETKINKNKLIYETLQLYYSIVGNNGIKFKLMNTVMVLLENEINKILSTFGGGLGCKIEIEEKVKSQVNFYITKNNKERGSRQCCGSERMKLELATRIGLGRISSCMRGGVLFLDEVLSCMDSTSKTELQEILLKMKVHYKSILLITHNEEIKGECDKYLLIEREKNYSHIRNGDQSLDMDLPTNLTTIDVNFEDLKPKKNKTINNELKDYISKSSVIKKRKKKKVKTKNVS
ncbi:MAG: hypothetical protein CMF62_03655 [Magnetococcales bacterium]|nr:hypothetical protein [Magnetococcales bacterium]